MNGDGCLKCISHRFVLHRNKLDRGCNVLRSALHALLAAVFVLLVDVVCFNARWLDTNIIDPISYEGIGSVNGIACLLSDESTADVRCQGVEPVERGDGTLLLEFESDAPHIDIDLKEQASIGTVSFDLLDSNEERTGNDEAIVLPIYDAGNTLRIGIWGKGEAIADDTESTVIEEPLKEEYPAEGGYRHMATQTACANIPATETLLVRTSDGEYDDCASVRIVFEGVHAGDTRTFSADAFATAGKPVPYDWSWMRISLLSAAALLILIVRPGSSFRKIGRDGNARASNKSAASKAICSIPTAVLAFTVIATSSFAALLPSIVGSEDESNASGSVATDTAQYQHVADALLAGRSELLIEPPEWLVEADNPYDYEMRAAMGEATGEPALFDYAYHDGSYYSYFGVGPAAALFAPYKAITGEDLGTSEATSVLAFAMSVSIWLVAISARRYFLVSKAARGSRVEEHAFPLSGAASADMLLAGSVATLASGVLQLALYPSFYHIAIMSGVACAASGIACWLFAIKRDGDLSRPLLAIGGALVGASVLCRPQLMLSALLAFPIFWQYIVGDGRKRGDGVLRSFFAANANAVKNTACVIVPFMLMIAAAMAWNAIRFGSPFDFGSDYNLTGFDMVERADNIWRTVFSSAMYLFAPFIPQSGFPFIANYTAGTPFFGTFEWKTSTIVEPYYAGVLFAYPACALLAVAVFASPSIRDRLKERNAFGISVIAVLVALALILLDSSVAVTQRYQSDFMWLLAIPCCFAIYGSGFEKETGKQKKEETPADSVFTRTIIVLHLISVVVCFMTAFAQNRYEPLLSANPDLFFTVESWFLQYI